MIIVRIMLTELKTAFAAGTLATSFARSRTSINPFDNFLSSGCRDFASVVETQGSCGGTVRVEGCEEDFEY